MFAPNTTAALRACLATRHVAIACLSRGGKLLLVRSGRNSVCLPWGEQRENEQHEDAARRICLEQTGETVIIDDYPPYYSEVAGVSVACYRAQPAHQETQAPADAQRAFWGEISMLKGARTAYDLGAVGHIRHVDTALQWGAGEQRAFETLLSLAPSAHHICVLAAEWGVVIPAPTLRRLVSEIAD